MDEGVAASIAHRRLLNQQISSPTNIAPEKAVSYLGAIQAQDYQAALWAIGLRTRNATIEKVKDAIEEGKIIRTWPLRHTLHFISPADVRWMLSFYRKEKIPSYQRKNGLTEEILVKGLDILSKSLEKSGRLTYREMHVALKGSAIPELSKNEVRGHIIRRAGRDGLVCFGPHQGKTPTFMLLSDWAPKAKAMGREDALCEIAARYFTSHGPATLQDFMWWSGLGSGDAKIGIERASPLLIAEEIDGRRYYMQKKKGAPDSDGARLLPAFDEYIVSYRDRSAVLGNERTQRMLSSGRLFFTHSNGIFLPVIVFDGQVLGTWKRKAGRGRTLIELLPFVKFTAEQMRSIKTAAESYGDFMQTEVELRLKL